MTERTADVVEPVAGRLVAPLDHAASAIFVGLITAGLAVAGHLGPTAMIIAVAAAQTLLIGSWVFGTGVPGRSGALAAGAVAAVAADVLVAHWPQGQLGTLIAVLGLAIPVLFVHQLARGAGRARVVESLSDIALLVVATTAMAALIQLRHEIAGPVLTVAVVLTTGAALLAGHLVDLVWTAPRFDPAVSRGLPAAIGSVVAGALVAFLRLRGSVEFTAQRAVLLGAAISAIAALLAVAAGFIAAGPDLAAGRIAHRLRPLFGELFTFALVAPIAYLICLGLRG